jgi:hypothetical protein
MVEVTARATLAPLLQGVPVEEATFHAGGDGFLGRRAARRRAKLVGSVAPVLATALQPGEVVRFATRGYRYWFSEYYFAGVAAYVHNHTALVLTDRRLLLVQLRGRGAGDLKHQVRLGELRGAESPLLGAWRLALADGTKLAFVGVPRADRRRLAALLAETQARAGAPAGAPAAAWGTAREVRPASLEHLCPACLAVVPGPAGGTLACPAPGCRIPFRDPVKAARLSALVPGLGDLYLRHHLFGALEFLGSMGLLGVALLLLLDLGGEGGAGLAIAAAVALFLVGVPRLIDHRITLHMGRKGLVPLALAPAPGGAARNLPMFPAWAPALFAAGLALAGGVAWLGAEGLRGDRALREASALVERGRLDEGRAAFEALAAAGEVTQERRVRFALALLEAGDLEGMDEVRAGFTEAEVEAGLAGRWNAAFEREQAAIAAYREGLGALARGEEDVAGERLGRALPALAGVKRPRLARSLDEARLHVAAALLAPPVDGATLDRARALHAAASAGPPAQRAAVLAALRSLDGDVRATAAEVARADGDLPRDFRLLLLEARHRVADAAGRKAIAGEVAGWDADALPEDDLLRLEALREP